MSQHYSNPRREADPRELPDLEVFHHNGRWAPGEWSAPDIFTDSDSTDPGHAAPAGWYWWACLPGCLPDSEPSGPFTTESEALADAREAFGQEDDEDDAEVTP